MKCFALALLLSSFAIAKDPVPEACGPQTSFKWLNGVSAPAQPEQGMALIYVLGFGTYAADGHKLAKVSRSFTVLQLSPGEHHLCGEYHPGFREVIGLHSITAKAGESYYLEMNFAGHGPYSLRLLDPDEGRYRISKLPFTMSTPK